MTKKASQKHIIDPDKLSQTWGMEWKHYQVPIEEGGEDVGSYIFDMPNGVVVAFHVWSPAEIIVDPCEKGRIVFENVSKVYYFKYQKMFVAEAVTSESFSEIRIYKDGDFAVKMSRGIYDYKYSFATIYKENEPVKK